jgi:hypothetical protein
VSKPRCARCRVTLGHVQPASAPSSKPPASLGRLEVVAATIGVERAEQPCCATTSRTPRRLDAVPFSSTRKAEYSAPVASSIVTTRSCLPPSPGSQACVEASWCSIHAHHRTQWPLLAMRRARLGRCHQTRAVQMQLGHRVAQRVVVPLPQLLVEVLHREAAVELAIQTQHRSPERAAVTVAREDPATRSRPRDADHASAEMSARTRPSSSAAAIWLRSDGSVRPSTSKNASDVSPRECLPGPFKPPVLEAPYDRTLHELQTPDKPRASHKVRVGL